MTRFSIKETFILGTRKLFVLIGNIEEGNIEPGMILISPSNDLSLVVHSIEDVRSSMGPAVIGIVFKFKNEAEWNFLNKMAPNNLVLFEKILN